MNHKSGGTFFWKKRVGQTCFLCDERAITGEHVPPKGFFPTSLRMNLNLLRIPACFKHNNNSKLDDEYARTALAIGSPESTTGLQLFEERVISAALQGREGLLAAINRQMKPVFYRHTSGILEPRFSYELDKQRVQVVMDKIARGLFWHHTGSRVPNNYCVSPYVRNRSWNDTAVSLIWSLPIFAIGNKDVFEYRYGGLVDQQNRFRVYIAMNIFGTNKIEIFIHHIKYRPPTITANAAKLLGD